MATEYELISAEQAAAIDLQRGLNNADARILRAYISRFNLDMTTAELIGAYRKLVDTDVSTDEEECALLDLLEPLA